MKTASQSSAARLKAGRLAQFPYLSIPFLTQIGLHPYYKAFISCFLGKIFHAIARLSCSRVILCAARTAAVMSRPKGVTR